jgi:hypothetical protein
MRNLIRILLIVVVALILVIQTRPATYHVERSATIAASAETVSPLVTNFHRWAEWSPWEHRDPNMQRTYSGAESGTGAIYHWTGNKDVGEGQMTVMDASAQKVDIKLEFLKPFKSTCSSAFAFTPGDGGTRVLWTMDGKNDFLGKAMTMFGSMDKMIGPDFESGLAKLKQVAEAAPAAADSSAAGAKQPS